MAVKVCAQGVGRCRCARRSRRTDKSKAHWRRIWHGTAWRICVICLSYRDRLEGVSWINAPVESLVVTIGVALRVVIEASRVCAQRVGRQFTIWAETNRGIASGGLRGDRQYGKLLLSACHSF